MAAIKYTIQGTLEIADLDPRSIADGYNIVSKAWREADLPGVQTIATKLVRKSKAVEADPLPIVAPPESLIPLSADEAERQARGQHD